MRIENFASTQMITEIHIPNNAINQKFYCLFLLYLNYFMKQYFYKRWDPTVLPINVVILFLLIVVVRIFEM